MLIRLGLLGALGYAGYRLLNQQRSSSGSASPAVNPAPRVALAGGPLSGQATLQHTADAPEGDRRPVL